MKQQQQRNLSIPEIDNPIDGDSDFAVPAGDFHQVDRFPGHPGGDSSHLDSHDFGDGGISPKRSELAKAGEQEFGMLLFPVFCQKISRTCLGLANGMLGGWR